MSSVQFCEVINGKRGGKDGRMDTAKGPVSLWVFLTSPRGKNFLHFREIWETDQCR